ncbi:N(4)-(beta-N-acetylglucosaminyl)-L-asparaginase [Maribacter polysiphoniae]|uniref:N(4)-(Beta-N-acetylglucosaminyl)-L-asparaginase n=1 Tax=Maribacter polysiphoniae TaxID=429344 RepID=A0A316DYQ8_9FLAO|nr:N(4)-(beta-N-acetylglucosaminyl)-L-asparaginase [Maribacter polysiphoniae]MBD1259617.1 N(4)-(beta-N-acetylglucosaminyl)-L-asparaginase [Maribacter polysiphoniae]PWK23244.1 N4-(beta-N-acetylglucosaminyl)-L-asparaginase [Maribacter polysiphoniae]
MKRRKFLKNSSTITAGLVSAPLLASCQDIKKVEPKVNDTPTEIKPIAICTWNFENATAKAWEVLKAGGSALDAVEQGVMVEEADENNQTVGIGGRPDRNGNVTLDSCIMDKDGNCGAVLCMQNIAHPVSVARKVMEDTPHVMLAGKGAEQFAYEKGFEKVNLLTEKSKQEWLEWKKTSQYKPIINIENHDTIGMLAIDRNGDISGACTTSGMAYKYAGRVGDSPIIGAGLFVDNEIGGATATGVGEEVVRTVGSFLIVELMRQGKSPQEACEEGVKRIIAKNKDNTDFQIGFIAINKKGETGSFCIQPGFTYRQYSEAGHINHPSDSFIKS